MTTAGEGTLMGDESYTHRVPGRGDTRRGPRRHRGGAGLLEPDDRGRRHAGEGDEFVYRDDAIRFSRFRVTEVVPGRRVVWQVLDAHLDFVADHDEWTGTRVLFEVTPQDGGTRLRFTHEGLAPTMQCFSDCSRGWDGVIGQSLKDLITEGRRLPER